MRASGPLCAPTASPRLALLVVLVLVLLVVLVVLLLVVLVLVPGLWFGRSQNGCRRGVAGLPRPTPWQAPGQVPGSETAALHAFDRAAR